MDVGASSSWMWWQKRITSNFFKGQVAWSINSSDILFQFLPIPVLDLFSVNLYSLEKGFDRKQWSTAISEDHIRHTYRCKALWTESIRCSETHHQCILFQCSDSPLVWSDCNNCYQRYIFLMLQGIHFIFCILILSCRWAPSEHPWVCSRASAPCQQVYCNGKNHQWTNEIYSCETSLPRAWRSKARWCAETQ